MGKLTELVTKGVRLIVTDNEAATHAEPDAVPTPREIPAEELQVPERAVAHSEVAADVASFGAVYQEAGIEVPVHGYGIDKVAEMLENKRFATLSKEAKATAVLVALEAASVAIKDVIQDAVARDQALDAFEADKERELKELKTQNESRIQDLNRQLEELIQKINTEVQALKQASEKAEQAFGEMQLRKHKEEERLQGIVAHFVESGSTNPITTGSATPPPAAPKPGPA